MTVNVARTLAYISAVSVPQRSLRVRKSGRVEGRVAPGLGQRTGGLGCGWGGVGRRRANEKPALASAGRARDGRTGESGRVWKFSTPSYRSNGLIGPPPST